MGSSKDLHYKRLNELIFDEEQIVTSVSIAKELKTSASEAQNLLNAYVHDIQKQKSEDFHVTYLLCGTLKNGKGLSIYLVKEDDLNDKKCLFDNISTEIIYSVQKGKLINFNMIASTNSFLENGIAPPLVSKNFVKRDIKSRKQPQTAATTCKQDVAAKSSESSCSSKSSGRNIQENGKSHTQSSQKHLKNGGIASFFAKATIKTQNNTNSKNTVENEISKQNVVGDVTQNTPKEEQNVQNELVIDEKMAVDNEDHKNQKPSVLKSDGEHSTKKRKKESKNNGPNKKRKRIQEVCDSDSSDMFDDAENENNIIEMSDEEPAHVPPVNHIPLPKNKRRKAVDKTYVDEEGFIVTTTEFVYESASEDEEKDSCKPKLKEKVLPLKKNEKMNVESKILGNKGKQKKQTSAKQPTLMSFFKKS